jgi:hypothetical protein
MLHEVSGGYEDYRLSGCDAVRAVESIGYFRQYTL